MPLAFIHIPATTSFAGTSLYSSASTPPCCSHKSHPTKCNAEDQGPAPRRLRPKRKPSAFENTIEDLTMKRMGRGSIYYGERVSADGTPDPAKEEDMLLKPDPVLITGATGRTGQWIALGLVNQRFNVRVLARSFDAAEKLFGPSGSNLDVFQGSVCNPAEVQPAVEGAVSVVVASGAPWWWPSGFDSVDVAGVRNLLDACKHSASVKRFVLISAADPSSGRGRAKRQAEALVRDSGLPYVILRAANLRDSEGGLRQIKLMPGAHSNDFKGAQLTRVDLAQSVCQALVYDRTISKLRDEDPEGDFDFPNCVVSIQNGPDPYVPDKRFWRKEFNRISDAYREKTNVEEDVTVE